MQNLIKEIKQEGQDFEFYPTTKEMINVIYNDIGTKDSRGKYISILDVGCGNGNFFNKCKEISNEVDIYHKEIGLDGNSYLSLEEQAQKRPYVSIDKKFAIEKSEILINNLPKDVVVLGTDFWENTLIDKEVDIIFSNPPYSQFESWSSKIIKEAYAKAIYLVIPTRWQDSQEIKVALESRKFETKILGSFDFLDGERQARAKVDIIKIARKELMIDNQSYGYSIRAQDPFDSWFNEEFKVNLDQEEKYSYDIKQEKKEEIKNAIVQGSSLIETLTELYNQDMATLLSNYKAVCTLDVDLLKELGISIDNLKKGLKEKIRNNKHLYWHEFFNNFDKITNCLISSKRQALLEKLHENVSIDFNKGNIYAIVIWVIKNANGYFDDQLKEIYLELTETDFVKKYKSNQRTWEQDRWRYKKEGNNSHYALEYRVITHQGYRQDIFVSDVNTIARNLGFSHIGDVKTFKNGNVHFRFDKDFIKAFNIEAGRLFGWLQSPQDVVDEFQGDITAKEAEKHFKNNLFFQINEGIKLLT